MFFSSKWIAIITILSLGSTVAACNSAGSASSTNAPTVQVAVASRSASALGLSFSGNIVAKQQVSIVPKVAGRVTAVNVDVGSAVKAGDALLELDKDAANAQIAQAEAGLAAAQAKLDGMLAGPRPEQIAQLQANLDAANQKLTTMQNGPRPETVAQAQANLTAAQAKLDQVKAGPTKDQIDAAEHQVALAKNQLYQVQAAADAALGSRLPNTYTKDQKEAQSGIAWEQIQIAQANLDQLKAGPTKEQLDQAQAAVDAAQKQLDLAQAPFTEQDIAQATDGVTAVAQQLKLAQNPYTKQDIDAMRAQVAQAKAAADLVRVQVAETTVRAPFDGVVAQRLVSVGSMAGPTAPVLTVLSRDTEVAINVDETSLGALKNGLSATLETSAYPGAEFKASVTAIAPSIDPKTRTALVRLAPDDPDGKLRDGMLATARIGADSQESALLVPSGAIVTDGADTVVYVVSGGKVARRIVQTGTNSGNQVAITSGLSDGERVVVSGATDLKDGEIVIVK